MDHAICYLYTVNSVDPMNNDTPQLSFFSLIFVIFHRRRCAVPSLGAVCSITSEPYSDALMTGLIGDVLRILPGDFILFFYALFIVINASVPSIFTLQCVEPKFGHTPCPSFLMVALIMVRFYNS